MDKSWWEEWQRREKSSSVNSEVLNTRAHRKKNFLVLTTFETEAQTTREEQRHMKTPLPEMQGHVSNVDKLPEMPGHVSNIAKIYQTKPHIFHKRSTEQSFHEVSSSFTWQQSKCCSWKLFVKSLFLLHPSSCLGPEHDSGDSDLETLVFVFLCSLTIWSSPGWLSAVFCSWIIFLTAEGWTSNGL